MLFGGDFAVNTKSGNPVKWAFVGLALLYSF